VKELVKERLPFLKVMIRRAIQSTVSVASLFSKRSCNLRAVVLLHPKFISSGNPAMFLF